MSNTKVVELNSGNRIYLGESYLYIEDDILYIVAIGDFDLESALRMQEATLEIRSRYVGLNTLIDINKTGKSTPEARKVWNELSHDDSIKIALVGLHPVAKVIASFTMVFSGNKKMRFFTSQEEALEWLKK